MCDGRVLSRSRPSTPSRTNRSCLGHPVGPVEEDLRSPLVFLRTVAIWNCAIIPMISFAKNSEDILLYRCFWDVATGFYVDVGAFHPEIASAL